VGGEGEPKKETKEFSIHLPTWISGVLKKFWFSGPATLNAAGAVDEQGAPVDGAGLKGQPVDFEYEDHHSELEPKPRYPIHPTIGEIGKATPGSGAKTARITVGGRRITLVNPDVTFAYASMFPEPLVISLLTALCIALVAILLARNLNRVPDRKQAALELAYLFLDDKIRELIGPHYKRYVPFVATLFIYILVMNLVGLIPGWASPTANVNVTAGLAIVVILYVQYEGIRVNGLGGYLMHFVGEPKWLAPLNFPLHVMGEVARVLSLTIRLFGNIFGEDVVIVILVALAAMFTKGIVPFQFPILFLAAFTSLVQAAVFSILTCVYIALMTTHEDHGGHPDEHGHGGDPGHVHDAAAPATAA
jgi:F-type H+-transporting ATPase subunit a